MAHEKTEAKNDRYNRFGTPMQWAAALVAGTASALTTFVNLVRTKFYSDAEFREGFALLTKHKNSLLQGLTEKHINRTMDLFGETMGEEPAFVAFKNARNEVNALKEAPSEALAQKYDEAAEEFFKKCSTKIEEVTRGSKFLEYRDDFIQGAKKIKSAHDGRIDTYSERMFGFFSKDLKGLVVGSWQRFKNFSDYAQRNISFKTAAALGVAFGGTMMVFNQLNTRDKLNEIDKQSERVDRKIDALLVKAGVGEQEIETRAEHKAHLREREKMQRREPRVGSHAAKITNSRAEAEASVEQARA